LGCPCATNTFAMMVPTSCSAGRAVSATQRKPCCRAAQPGPALAFQAPSFGARPHAAASQRRTAGATHLAVLHVYPLGRAQLPYFTVLRVEHGRAGLDGTETDQPLRNGGGHVHDGGGLRPRHGASAREAGWTAARCGVWRPFALACTAGAVRAAGGDWRAGRAAGLTLSGARCRCVSVRTLFVRRFIASSLLVYGASRRSSQSGQWSEPK
jgi:hypothetical protein